MDPRQMTTGKQQALKIEFEGQRKQQSEDIIIWTKYNCPNLKCGGQQRRPEGKMIICPDCGFIMK